MKTEDVVKLGATEEVANAIIGLYAEEMKGFIPKSRFDEVNEAKKNAEALLKERDTQIESLSKNSEATESLKNQLEKMKADNEKSKADYEAKIKDMVLNSAISEKLTGTNYKDLLIPKVDKTKLAIGDGGEVLGLDEQIKTIRENYKDLFVPVVSGGSTPPPKTVSTGGLNPNVEMQKIINDTSIPFADRIATFNKLSNKE